MVILPLKLIQESDQPLFGASIFNLAKLSRLDFPVMLGIAVSSPDIVLSTVLKHCQRLEKDTFEQSLTFIKNELASLSIPKELEDELGSKDGFLFKQKLIKSKQTLWLALLEEWINEIRSKLWREGFVKGLASELNPQVIFPHLVSKNFFGKIKLNFATAYFDDQFAEVIIKCPVKLEPKILKAIDSLVEDANKKLYIPQIYDFVIDKEKLLVVNLVPYTQTLHATKTEDIVLPKPEQKHLVKSAVKVVLNLSEGFTLEENVDGILIEAEKLTDFDRGVFKVVESSLSFPGKPVIFKLPDLLENGEVRGTLRLLNQGKLLDGACNIFLFARNKKGLQNLEIAIPFTRSVDEFLALRRELAAKTINRKGTLKFWLEMSTPENFINLEDYIETGFDGALINLDELQGFLGGYGFSEGEYYKKQIKTIEQFLYPYFKTIHKNKLPVLVMGNICTHPDILDFLIENGVWGVVANNALEAQTLPEHLSWVEKRVVTKRLA